ncbi:hypothetical protein HYU23_04085 [Candidatus Woesearchaeota archaeon]|nr:hypothetical protein [Candidatus Woesearchaeota archaeon]
MPDQRDDILNFIKYNGPVLPVQIAKHVNTNILFASAILSELVARKILRITHASIGGSPLYYLPGQEELMDARLSTALGGKEKEAYQLLKDKKVLWEKYMEPWQRVAVRNIKDFSVQIGVNADNNLENFWKHHLVSDEEAKLIIAEIMGYDKPKEDVVLEDSLALDDEKVINDPKSNNEILSSLVTDKQEKKIEQTTLIKEEVLIVKTKQKDRKEVKKEIDFYTKVLEFMRKNDVEILKEDIIKKDKEIDFVVNLMSSFGKLKYLIRAKNKPSINEADVSMIFSEGQLKKLPVILLYNGKLNKKAFLLAEQKMHGQLILKEI